MMNFSLLNNFLTQKKDQSSNWNVINVKIWESINYPWRPNNQELSKINEILNDLNHTDTVALLGSTPEIRKLAAAKNIKLDVIDFSENVYHEMGKISKSKKNEDFIKSDWIRYLSSKKGTYNLIIGDLIERLLSTKELNLLEKGVVSALKPKGKILLRSDFFIKNQNASFDIKLEIKKLIKKRLSVEKIVDQLFFILSREFKGKSQIIYLKKIENFLLDMKKNKEFSQKETKIIDLFIKNWLHTPFNFYCREKNEIESVWNKDFTNSAKIKKLLSSNYWITLLLWQRKK